jgi:hypothetical protein
MYFILRHKCMFIHAFHTTTAEDNEKAGRFLTFDVLFCSAYTIQSKPTYFVHVIKKTIGTSGVLLSTR